MTQQSSMTRRCAGTLLIVIGMAALIGASGAVHAAGFALIEQSGSGMGNAFAGSAASAEDASTIYFNPAGMTRLSGKQIVVGAHALRPSAEFNNQGSVTTGGALRGGDGGDAGDWAYLGNLYLSWGITDSLWLGLGINSPFGLRTEYDRGWIGRYQALTSDLQTINVNPSIAWKVNEMVSLGFGVDIQQAKATLSKAIDVGAVLGVPQSRDGFQELDADDWGYGFNAGAMFQIAPDMRVGVTYRSRINYTLAGSNGFAGIPSALAAASSRLRPSGAQADLTVPDSASVSVFQTYSDKWEFMGDITWTHWSTFDEIRVKFDNGAPDNVTPQNWRDTWRFSLGLNYKLNDKWKLRSGVAWDQTPVRDATLRNPRIPDNNRTWVAVGASWYFVPNASLDFGYAHLFIPSSSINHTEPGAGTLNGTYDSSVDILSVQVAYKF